VTNKASANCDPAVHALCAVLHPCGNPNPRRQSDDPEWERIFHYGTGSQSKTPAQRATNQALHAAVGHRAVFALANGCAEDDLLNYVERLASTSQNGAGEIGLKTARAFQSRGAEEIFVSNRRFERAQALATLTGGRAVHFEDWEPEFRDLDILVSCTAAPHTIITVDKLAPLWRTRRQGPLFMIDLAVPRDIDPEVERLDDVFLCDLDAIQLKAEKSLADRKRESEKCFDLIERHVQEFALWLEHSPSGGAGCFVPEFAVT
jgi:hypothetical protein